MDNEEINHKDRAKLSESLYFLNDSKHDKKKQAL